MQRASGAGKGTQRLWAYFTSGQRAVFLPYDARSDTFVACSESGPPRFPCAEALGEVGSAARETMRKRYRDLDVVIRTPVLVGSNPLQAAASVAPIVASQLIPAVPPIPPMEPVELEATPDSEVRYLQVSPGEVAVIPELSRALGNSRAHSWAVGELLKTLSTWFLTQTEDALRRGGERNGLVSELQRVQDELRRFACKTSRFEFRRAPRWQLAF